ncbi:MAG: hypothetical protein CSA75_04210 [Sorangium cellulosum]|nr:MAG: hypothetical protein CSA75_04210 [Sorangium cellulosum]
MVAHADDPPTVLHEFIPPDPAEDVKLSATTLDGRLPAAMETESGLVQAPDTTRMPTATERAYGAIAPRSFESKYNPDRDTRRPLVSRYDDPFSPATAPYKRLRAYDGVRADFSLTVSDVGLVPILEGGVVRSGEDAFFGDFTVDVVPGEPVRIPTVGPGARIVRRASQPPMPFELVRDGAENWFVRAGVRVRMRLILQLAAPRAAFGGSFPDTDLSDLLPVPPVPPNVRLSVSDVVGKLGLKHERSFRNIITTLVTYFRGFEPSAQPPKGRDNIYLDLALSRKGVCRHRAYAFVVTTLGMGIPSRMILNEAHAWVEVHDGSLWRRIDLGGASTQLEQDEPSQPHPAHSTPEDPFPWPDGADPADSGEGMAVRAREGWANASPRVDDAFEQPSGYSYQDPRLSGKNTSINAISTEIQIVDSDRRVLRGSPMRVEGKVSADVGSCGFVRVNVFLKDPKTSSRYEIGAVSTDENGRFSGSVIVPLEIRVGDYDVVVATPGDARCGPGTSGP